MDSSSRRVCTAQAYAAAPVEIRVGNLHADMPPRCIPGGNASAGADPNQSDAIASPGDRATPYNAVQRRATLCDVATERRVHRSFRLRPDTSARLERRAAETGETYTTLAERFIDEGLRRIDHPAVDFVDGPAGRRASLVGTGLGVWEVIEVLRAHEGDAGATAGFLEIPLGLVEAAEAYRASHPAEIERWIERNRAVAARALGDAGTAGQAG